jgi:hypothetical protein
MLLLYCAKLALHAEAQTTGRQSSIAQCNESVPGGTILKRYNPFFLSFTF